VPDPATWSMKVETIASHETSAALVIENPVRGVAMLPAAPPRVIFPAPLFNVRGKAPWTPWLSSMSPIPAPVPRVAPAARVIGLAKEISAPDVVMDPPKITDPLTLGPFCVKGPERTIAPAAVLVKVPVWVTVRGPPPVVVIAPPRIILPELMATPKLSEVMRAPLRVVVPVPEIWVIDAA
jgi:hypothetical protein